MKSDVIIEVIDRLVGSIEPYGSESIDKERMENLETLIEVMDEYISEIIKAARYRNRYEYSILKIANRAYEWLDELREYVEDELRDMEEKKNG